MPIKPNTNTTRNHFSEKPVMVRVNGKEVPAQEGDLVSTVLHQQGITGFHQHPQTGKLSGVYCMMGVCYQCLVTINGLANCRACQTFIQENMHIETAEKQNHE